MDTAHRERRWRECLRSTSLVEASPNRGRRFSRIRTLNSPYSRSRRANRGSHSRRRVGVRSVYLLCLIGDILVSGRDGKSMYG